MHKSIHTNFATANEKLKSAIKTKRQGGFLPFTERPSNKYGVVEEAVTPGTTRMNAFDLFSLFTADIIKEKVTFVR